MGKKRFDAVAAPQQEGARALLVMRRVVVLLRLQGRPDPSLSIPSKDSTEIGFIQDSVAVKRVQSGWSGCRTGKRKKQSSSHAQLGQATYLAVA